MARADNSVPVFDHSALPNAGRMPHWIRQPLSDGGHFGVTARAVTGNRLHTVCEEARCPNRGECWSRGTATFMLLGDTCTRACGFCAVKTGRPSWFDGEEPQRVAAAAAAMGLDYVVITSVNRDDLPDGGAGIFAQTLRLLREARPDIGLEVLTPDFHRCQSDAVATLLEGVRSAPGDGSLVWGHNMETVPRLYQQARKGAAYQRSLDLLALAAGEPGVCAKSALMLGLGVGTLHGMLVSLMLVWVVSESHPLPEFKDAGLEVGLSHFVGHVAYGAVVGLVVGLSPL